MALGLRRISVIVWLLLTMIGGFTIESRGQAQGDPDAIVRSQEIQSAGLAASWLNSSDARVRAWGAYLALRDRRRELLPQLAGLMDAYLDRAVTRVAIERDDHDAMLGVLDAIIQMDKVEGVQESSGLSAIPPGKGAKLYPEFPAQAVILLARGGHASSRFLLDIFKQETGPTSAWLAAGNLLAHWRESGFAGEILRNFTIDVRIRIIDDGSGAAPPMGIGGSCAGSLPSSRPGWPLVGNYFLGRGGGIYLAGYTERSSYTRTVGPADDNSQNVQSYCTFFFGDRNVMKAHLLTDLVFEPPDSSVRSLVTGTITWQNSEQYLRDFRAFLRQQQDVLDGLIQRLRNAGLVNVEGSAGLRPTLQVTISDARTSGRSTLPVVSNIDSNVKIVR
jgi:hypothetical protein